MPSRLSAYYRRVDFIVLLCNVLLYIANIPSIVIVAHRRCSWIEG